MDFVHTNYAKKLFDSQIPRMIKALNRIADVLEKQNEIIENGQKEDSIKQNYLITATVTRDIQVFTGRYKEESDENNWQDSFGEVIIGHVTAFNNDEAIEKASELFHINKNCLAAYPIVKE